MSNDMELRRGAGFTLIELLVVVAVVGIIVAIAVSNLAIALVVSSPLALASMSARKLTLVVQFPNCPSSAIEREGPLICGSPRFCPSTRRLPGA